MVWRRALEALVYAGIVLEWGQENGRENSRKEQENPSPARAVASSLTLTIASVVAAPSGKLSHQSSL